MDEFRQSDEQTAEIEVYEAEQEMKNMKFKSDSDQSDGSLI